MQFFFQTHLYFTLTEVTEINGLELDDPSDITN